MPTPPVPVLLCLSHLRWDFVFQRPQHLMTRAASEYRVIFFEEPVEARGGQGRLRKRITAEGVLVATPELPIGLDAAEADSVLRILLNEILQDIGQPDVAWYYTPMALGFASHLRPRVTVYDVMDELAAFRGASPRLALLERRLLKLADVVFTGGASLHEAKRHLHENVHLFPSSVDAEHFRAARVLKDRALSDPHEGLARPRIGFFGVIDERMDLALLAGIAELRPDWEIVMVGPVVKIDPLSLPANANIHWLGAKSYNELPQLLSCWDVGIMPFALNEATQFISPTKTPEFLAAGLPVVSTPVPDVVEDWGKDGCVEIATGPKAFVASVNMLLSRNRDVWQSHVDRRLSRLSWSTTWSHMRRILDGSTIETSLNVAATAGMGVGEAS
jgi:glycosyltransferase involved in cell wall biosynthesis